ncbi:MAG: AbrB family looped-hinge helix DNA binding protein [Candidatus Nitrosomirales archaeon]|jgi:AbrB family looped-hinge helix DNA binding protein
MVKFKVRVGSKGQLVIPKIVRTSLGLTENSYVSIEVKDKYVEIKPLQEDFIARWDELRKKEGLDVTKKMKYGDAMYEEVFK